jgi:hypothetical protein
MTTRTLSLNPPGKTLRAAIEKGTMSVGAGGSHSKGTSAMAKGEMTAASLQIDEIAAATSRAVLEAVSRINIDRPELVVNPRIWFGIWVDIQHNFPGKGQFDPAGPG